MFNCLKFPWMIDSEHRNLCVFLWYKGRNTLVASKAYNNFSALKPDALELIFFFQVLHISATKTIRLIVFGENKYD